MFNQQSINEIPKIWGQLNKKGNGSSPDLFSMPSVCVKKNGLAREETKDGVLQLQKLVLPAGVKRLKEDWLTVLQ